MTTIFESKNFIVEPHPRPEVDRLDGGHIVINPKVRIEDRQQLTPDQAVELMRLTILVGEAMKMYFKSIGLELHRVNYQDNGNWRPEQHVHLYGRAKKPNIKKLEILSFLGTSQSIRFYPTTISQVYNLKFQSCSMILATMTTHGDSH